MKRTSKTYLTGTSIAALTFFLNIGIADAACTAMTSCSELGYTQSSCQTGYQSIGCPFDGSQLKCVKECDKSGYTATSCADSEICLKCQDKYKVIGCKQGYFAGNFNGDIKCRTHPACTGYILRTSTCPDNAVCDDNDICKTDYNTYKKVYCYGERFNMAHFNGVTNKCEGPLAFGTELNLNADTRGLILNTYEEGNSLKVDIAILRKNKDTYTLVTRNDSPEGAFITNIVANCFGPYITSTSNAMAARTQHENSCPQGMLTTWDNIIPNIQDPTYPHAGISYHLANIYELDQMRKLGLLKQSTAYLASMISGIEGVTQGYWVLDRWYYSYMSRGGVTTMYDAVRQDTGMPFSTSTALAATKTIATR